jgi:hypothetical protein
VVRDKAGLVDPRLPTEVASAQSAWVLGLFAYLVMFVLCLVAGWPVRLSQPNTGTLNVGSGQVRLSGLDG